MIAIIAMKENFAVVATDSRSAYRDGTFTQVPKIYKCSDSVVAFGIGNRDIYNGYFHLLANSKNELTYADAVSRLQYWRTLVEATERSRNTTSTVGVCGFHDGSPESTLIRFGEPDAQETVMHPMDGSALCIFPPPELTRSECEEIFTLASQDVARSRRKYPEVVQCLRACQRTIVEVSRQSQSVDDAVQYWGYSDAPRYLKFYMPIT